MESLISRILIENVNGGEIAYLYNREAFDLLEIEKQHYDNSQFIEIGQIINYAGTRYKVKSINFKLEEKMYKIRPGIGINLYSPTDPSDFNSQINVFVEKVK